MTRSVFLMFALALSLPYGRSFGGQFAPSQMEAQQNLSQQGVAVRGEISTSNSLTNGWTIELRGVSDSTWRRAALRAGSFEFRDVTKGKYRLCLTDATGSSLYDETISVGGNDEMLSITVPTRDVVHVATPYTVSVQQLQHKVPRKARSEFLKGLTALKKQQVIAAVDHMKAAIALDPAYANAHTDLGVAYYRLNDYQHSLEEFRKAVELAPGDPMANNNLCIALVWMRQYAEAGQVAERVLRNGSRSAIAHYALAVSLLMGGGSRNEALTHLRRAQEDLPKLHLLTASVLADAGRRSDAAQELQLYLRSGANQEVGLPDMVVEAWLTGLKQ